MSLLPVGIGAFDSGYTIDQSLRLRNSAPAMFRRTPSSAGNRRTWTISWWAKRSKLGNAGFTVFSAGTGTSGDTAELVIKYDNNYPDSLHIQTTNTNIRSTNEKYRDPSAWHHVVVAFDTTQATAANRHKVYVNGEEITSFNISNNLAQNTDTAVNNTVQQAWGYFGRINSQYFDGYLTEMYIIDGQQLTANDFGEFDDDTGVWKPKEYTGTYGTNGAYLNGTGTTYIEDVSGNNNDFTNVNLQLTNSAVSTYDSMADVPTLTNADTANFCTWNPLGTALATYTITLSEANLKASYYVPTNNARINGTLAVSSGKWYFEFQATAGSPMVGFATTDGSAAYVYDGNVAVKRLYAPITGSNTSASYGATWNTTNTIGVALDLDAGTLTFYKDNVSQGVAYTGLSGTFTPTTGYQGGTTVTGLANFGQRPFAYTPPTGFLKLNTFNLPDSTIEDGSDYFNTVLWTGNNTYPRSITGVGFQPDLLWTKNRSSAYDHLLMDVLRGTGNLKWLSSSQTNAEGTYFGNANVTSLDSDGFTIGSTSGTNVLNNSTSIVAWNWKANGSGSSNTDGSITSTVSANTTAGFSIVGYTGSPADTVGHGLGVAPQVIIHKDRDYGVYWRVFHYLMSGSEDYNPTDNLHLNATNAYPPGIGAATRINGVNATTFTNTGGFTSSDQIAYCFAPIEGYSAFGSYTGNGSADGAFVYTGFRPAFVIIKNSTAAVNWYMYDSVRNTYNETNFFLRPNIADAELTGTPIDLTSNGFKIRSSSSAVGTSGQTYIYMAFAENPFKNANAR